jgi:hypothetical protein
MTFERKSTDLANCAAPEDVEVMLSRIADIYNESATELSSAWQDDQAGKVWGDFARIMECAAEQCAKARAKRDL